MTRMLTKTRAVAVVAALLTLVAVLVTANRGGADAHGSLVFPKSRTYACYLDGKAGGGNLQATNPACKEAIARGGTQPLYDWFGNNISDAAGRTVGYIPDGKLCGPTPKYDAYNAPRADWPADPVKSGPVTVRYGANAGHGGNWRLWITKEGYDPTQPLKWSDLEDKPFSTYDTGAGVNADHPGVDDHTGVVYNDYVWTATLPARTGRQLILSVWTRAKGDSPETFYDCADVDFGGGSATPGTTTPRPTTPRPTTPSTSVPNPGPTTPPATEPPAPTGPRSCSASVKVVSSWAGGYQGEVTVTNTGGETLAGWIAGVDLPAGSTVSQGWNGEYFPWGDSAVTVWSTGWSGTVKPGATVTSGFLASGSGTPGAFGCLA
jgi:predicted carbohydrate-binding protein with CBM5 and CBM33 domain